MEFYFRGIHLQATKACCTPTIRMWNSCVVFSSSAWGRCSRGCHDREGVWRAKFLVSPGAHPGRATANGEADSGSASLRFIIDSALTATIRSVCLKAISSIYTVRPRLPRHDCRGTTSKRKRESTRSRPTRSECGVWEPDCHMTHAEKLLAQSFPYALPFWSACLTECIYPELLINGSPHVSEAV